MSARLITDISQVKPNLNARIWDLIVDNNGSIGGNLDVDTINNQPYPPAGELPTLISNKILRTDSSATEVLWGDVPHGTSRQILQTNSAGTSSEWTSDLSVDNLTVNNDTDLIGNLSFNGDSGLTGQVLVKSGAASQSFQDLSAASIKGGTVNQVLISNGTQGSFSNNLSLAGTLSVASATNINGDLRFSSIIGTVGQYIKKTGASTQTWSTITPSDIGNGAARQLLQTNSAGTAAEWTSNVDIPGTLDCTGNAVFDGDLAVQGAVNIINQDLTLQNGDLSVILGSISSGGDIICGASLSLVEGPLIAWDSQPGVSGQVLLSDGPGNPPYWENFFASGSTTSFYQNSPVIDMNSSASVLLFDNASIDLSPGTTPTVSYSAGSFTLLRPGVWRVCINLRPSTMQFRSQVNIVLNASYKGSALTPYDGANTNPQSMSFDLIFSANLNDVLTVLSEPIVAGVVNINGTDTHGIATSTITLSWLNDGS